MKTIKVGLLIVTTIAGIRILLITVPLFIANLLAVGCFFVSILALGVIWFVARRTF